MDWRKPLDHPDSVHVGNRIQLMGGAHDGWEGVVIHKAGKILVVEMDSGEVVTMIHEPPKEKER